MCTCVFLATVSLYKLTTHRMLIVVWFSSDGQRPSSAGYSRGR
ncbi:MAG: hypothetical protein ACI9KE_001221 [Polyangiales bacterium]|jgi:hypothetical protein